MNAPEPTRKTFPAAAERPDGYPEDLPFLPGLRALVVRRGRTTAGRICCWFAAEGEAERPDMEAAMSRVIEFFRARGWELAYDEAMHPVGRMASLHRGNRERIVHVPPFAQGMLAVAEQTPWSDRRDD